MAERFNQEIQHDQEFINSEYGRSNVFQDYRNIDPIMQAEMLELAPVQHQRYNFHDGFDQFPGVGIDEQQYLNWQLAYGIVDNAAAIPFPIRGLGPSPPMAVKVPSNQVQEFEQQCVHPPNHPPDDGTAVNSSKGFHVPAVYEDSQK